MKAEFYEIDQILELSLDELKTDLKLPLAAAKAVIKKIKTMTDGDATPEQENLGFEESKKDALAESEMQSEPITNFGATNNTMPSGVGTLKR